MKNDFYVWFKKFVLRNKKILTACILLKSSVQMQACV